jgi:hypothetical protein
LAEVDEHERGDDRGQRQEQDGEAQRRAHDSGAVFAGVHDGAAEEEQPDHQHRVGNQGGDVGAPQERIDGLVDSIDVQGHGDRDGDSGVGDAAVWALPADDEQARHEHPHQGRDEHLGHPKTSQ